MHKLWMLCLACAALGGSPAAAITTHNQWDGSELIWPFGCAGSYSTTYGQVVTIPARMHTLSSFRFWLASDGNSRGSMVVRGEVYQWDGQKAAGDPLYESSPRKIEFLNPRFHRASFDAGIGVTPGAQYVVFASIDKDYTECTKTSVLDWGFIENSTYAGGAFVYQNNAGDSSKWTTKRWTVYRPQGDLVFKVSLSP